MKRNILANYVGQGWTALMGIAFVPLYIKYLGVEAYGLIGVFAMSQAWITLLDMGMASTVTREMARFRAGDHTACSIRNLFRSLELIYLLLGLFVCAGLWLVAPWLAQNWLEGKNITHEVIGDALVLMGVAVVFRWWSGFYRGVWMGLEKQVQLNGFTMLFAALRFGGVVPVLAWVSSTIQVFFLWQAAISIVECATLGLGAWANLPRRTGWAHFSSIEVRKIWRFAAGTFVTTILALMLTQADKLLLSFMLPLDLFGQYALAVVLAGGIGMLATPVAAAMYPRFTQLFVRGNEVALAAEYHRAAQLLTVVLAPAAAMLIFFPGPILFLWTGDALLSQSVAPILLLLALSNMLNGFMHVPYTLQLSCGWSGFAGRVNAVAVVILVPVLFWAVPKFGAIGAATVLVALNVGYVVVSMRFMHKRLLQNELRSWYIRDVGAPLASVMLASVAVWMASYQFVEERHTAFFIVVSCFVGTLVLAVWSAPLVRYWVFGRFIKTV